MIYGISRHVCLLKHTQRCSRWIGVFYCVFFRSSKWLISILSKVSICCFLYVCQLYDPHSIFVFHISWVMVSVLYHWYSESIQCFCSRLTCIAIKRAHICNIMELSRCYFIHCVQTVLASVYHYFITCIRIITVWKFMIYSIIFPRCSSTPYSTSYGG